jgi:hypothetical protein
VRLLVAALALVALAACGPAAPLPQRPKPTIFLVTVEHNVSFSGPLKLGLVEVDPGGIVPGSFVVPQFGKITLGLTPAPKSVTIHSATDVVRGTVWGPRTAVVASGAMSAVLRYP